MQYVTVYREHWVALLVFSTDILKYKARDELIGWAACFHWQRQGPFYYVICLALYAFTIRVRTASVA